MLHPTMSSKRLFGHVTGVIFPEAELARELQPVFKK